MASLFANITQGCQQSGGVLSLNQAEPGPGAGPNLYFEWSILDGVGNQYGGPFDVGSLPVQSPALVNGNYNVRVQATDQDTGTVYRSALFSPTINCATSGGGSAFQLDSYNHTDETAAGSDGTATVQASGGVAPLTASVPELSLSQAATSGQPNVFTGLPAGPLTLRVTDSSTPTPQVVQAQVVIAAYQEPMDGCQDEYADNYEPAATSGGTASCTYSPRWRSAWGRSGMAVGVAAVAGQTLGYVAAELRVGFRPGHPLAAFRPLGAPISLRATVGPDGYATFRLGPYLQPLLGVADGAGGYELDINEMSPDDYYVGYELRRTEDDTLLEHGYALYAAVPDEQLAPGFVLSAFAQVPQWPGFGWSRQELASQGAGRYGTLADVQPAYVNLPCPSNPLLVAWVNPQGYLDFWVFAGKTQLTDVVEDGQVFQRDGQRRYSERGESRRRYEARSGNFKGAGLAEGLATLWRSPQVWLKPTPDSEWVPVSIASGDFPVRRLGTVRNEVSVTFVEAAAQYAQGQ